MERILNEIVKKLISKGYDCDAFIEDRNIMGRNSDQAGVLIQIKALDWNQVYQQAKEIPLEIWIGYPTTTDNDILPIDEFEHIKVVANKFMYYLHNYEDDNDRRLVQIISSRWEQYFDFPFNEITTSGYHIIINLTKGPDTQC